MKLLQKRGSTPKQTLENKLNRITDNQLRREVCQIWNDNAGNPVVSDEASLTQCLNYLASQHTRGNK